MYMTHIIIYPRGDKDKIDVAHCHDYEKDEYALASRHTFTDEEEAIEHAMELAKTFSKTYVGNLPDGEKYHDYLD